MKLESLSVFFPSYNEAENLPILLTQALTILPSVAQKFEIIVVDDGSKDSTKAVVQQFAQKHPEIRLVSHPKNLGYGAALKTGFKAAQYAWVFFTDADLQFNLEEITKFLPFTKEYRAIIGYRQQRAEGLRREINAKLLSLFMGILFRLHVRDIDCAFKLFESKLVKSVELESTGAFTSTELLYKLKKKSINFKQLPVAHLPRLRGNPTGANLKVIIKAGIEAIKLYLKIKFRRLQQHQW